MSQIYGHKWASAYGDGVDRNTGKLTDTAEVWFGALAGANVTELQIRQGLQKTVEAGDPWPPSLPEFVARCRGTVKTEAVRWHGQDPNDPAIKALVQRHRPPLAAVGTPEQYLKRIREILGMPENER